jgi:UPF0755 protein
MSDKRDFKRVVQGTLAIIAVAWLVAFVAPIHSAGGKGIILTIQRGESADQVYSTITRSHVVSNIVLFRIFSKIFGIDRKIKAGKYLLSGYYSDYDVMRLISAGKSNLLVSVTIPEGMDTRQIAEICHHDLGVDSAAFAREALGDSMAEVLGVPSSNLEGYLFPDTYDFYYGTKPGEIMKRMTDEFKFYFNDSLKERARVMGYTVNQIMTMASIVEAEAQIDSERAIIASVYYNRLRKRMPLDADPTIEYALGKHTEIYYKDLHIKSPYNTYENYGLPPTPICSPGLKSIMAALYPDTTDYLYFVANGKGGHVFTVTFRAHKRAIRAYRRAMMRE